MHKVVSIRTKDMEEASNMGSIVDASIKDDVESEKCVVASHRTTKEQKDAMVEHLKTCDRTKIPIEWVIDIADESSGWFYATAYHFDDTTRMVHVMLPDKHNPTFDGHVLLDYRTLHLLECVDGKTDALFNKIVRDSIIKIRWELKWFEEDPDAPEPVNPDEQVPGRWIQSIGRYYIRIANQLLVEDEESTKGDKGFVMIPADINVRLHHCSKGKGQEDFNRLVLENQVQGTSAAVEEANLPLNVTVGEGARASGGAADIPPPIPPASGGDKSKRRSSKGGAGTPGAAGTGGVKTPGGGAITVDDALVDGLGKMWDTTKDLKETLSELLDEKEKEKADRYKMAKAFTTFSLDGDLDAGLMLYMKSAEIANKEDAKKLMKDSNKDAQNAVAEETWHLVQKVERGLGKLVRQTAGADASTPAGTVERDSKIRADLKMREDELSILRAAVPTGGDGDA